MQLWYLIAVGLLVLLLIYWRLRVYIEPNSETRHHYNVVIIGGSKGIGLQLASEFIAFGDRVLIASRKTESLQSATQIISKRFNFDVSSALHSAVCDITNEKDLQRLFDETIPKVFNNASIDIIINNAGRNAQRGTIMNVDTADIRGCIETNLIGTILSCRAAIAYVLQSTVQLQQSSHLYIFNTSGAGSDGRATANIIAYGVSKAGFYQLNKSLNAEISAHKRLANRVSFHTLQPGMVLTRLFVAGLSPSDSDSDPLSTCLDTDYRNNGIPLTEVSDTEREKKKRRLARILNALIESNDVVCHWLVPKIRGLVGSHRFRKGGAYIRWLTPLYVVPRLIITQLGVFNRKFFDEKTGKPCFDIKNML